MSEETTATYAFLDDGVVQSLAVLVKGEAPEGWVEVPKGKTAEAGKPL